MTWNGHGHRGQPGVAWTQPGVACTERLCVEEGADAVLVTNALGHLGPELEAFARRHTPHATTRRRW